MVAGPIISFGRYLFCFVVITRKNLEEKGEKKKNIYIDMRHNKTDWPRLNY